MILLDTNVLSELMKPRPDPAVLGWIDSQNPDDLWTSTIVVAEILSGLELMPSGKRQVELRAKAELMFSEALGGRILTLDLAAAQAYGSVQKIRKAARKPVDEMDALISAIAFANGASLATRNITHFEDCGIRLLNPWK
jgi:toxin FitB